MSNMGPFVEYKQELRTKAFINHKATIVLDTPEIEILDWKNKNGSAEYNIRYILDKSRGSLIIQGDCGQAILSWYNPQNTLEDLAHFSENIYYFIEKIQCASDIYTYNLDDIIKDIRENLQEEFLCDFDEDDDKEEFERVEEFLEHVKTHYQFVDNLYDFRREYCDEIDEEFGIDTEEHEGFWEAGKRINERVYAWTIGLQMAVEDLKNHE